MPALVLCKRTWAIGEDDLFFPAIVSVLWRVGWLIATAVVLEQYQDADSNTKLIVFLSVHIGIHFVIAVLELLLTIHSSRGSIFDTNRRRWVPRFLLMRIILFFVEMPWMMVGSVWAFDDQDATKVQNLLVFGWISVGVFLVKILCTFDPCGVIHAPSRTDRKLSDDEEYRASQRTWNRRCRALCCCASDDSSRGGAIMQVSQLFADFFKDIKDMTSSDISAGLALLQVRQEAEEQAHNQRNDLSQGRLPYTGSGGRDCKPEDICCSLNFDDSTQANSFEKAAYYMKYALAAYGWMFFVYESLLTGFCRLCPGCQCCCHHDKQRVSGDNCCQCETAAIRQTLNIEEDDLIYVNFHNGTYEPAFYVAVDHERKVVIVSCRGTLSLSDALTDVTASRKPMEVECIDLKFHAHEGMLKAANYVLKELNDKGLLTEAFDRAKQVSSEVDYNLVVVGHSLGAGTASLLAILLRSAHPEWNVTCFAYSVPGLMVSEKAVPYTKEFITSVVLGKDVVSHINFANLYRLRDTMREEAEQARSPKCNILLTCCCICCCRCCPPSNCLISDDKDMSVSETDGLIVSGHLRKSPSPTLEYQGIPEPLLHVPGNVIYLVKVPSTGLQCCGGESQHVAYWTDYRFFHTILLGPSMVGDHVPNKVNDALQNVLTQCGEGKLGTESSA
eukprot:m.152726 g.152726  ORF g.152726 m.152726 type:complete len:673 (+) comp38605_c0_seq1:15-2033(+)